MNARIEIRRGRSWTTVAEGTYADLLAQMHLIARQGTYDARLTAPNTPTIVVHSK